MEVWTSRKGFRTWIKGFSPNGKSTTRKPADESKGVHHKGQSLISNKFVLVYAQASYWVRHLAVFLSPSPGFSNYAPILKYQLLHPGHSSLSPF
jgi:hypothetical protein